MDHYRFLNDKLTRRLCRINQNPVNCKIPYCLKSVDIKTLKPEDFPDANLWKDSVYLLLDFITSKVVDNNSALVHLDSKILKFYFGNHYAIFLKILCENEIIVKAKNFKVGAHSNAYTLSKKAAKSGFRWVTLSHPKLVGKRKHQIALLEKSNLKLLLKRKELAVSLFDPKLQLNVEESLKYLDALHQHFKSRAFRQKIKDFQDIVDLQEYWKERHEMTRKQVQVFNDIDYSMPKVQIRGERIHTKVTALLSPLRNFLSYDGAELVYLDISNSQPFHSIKLLQPSFWDRSKSQKAYDLTLKNLDNQLYKRIHKGEKERKERGGGKGKQERKHEEKDKKEETTTLHAIIRCLKDSHIGGKNSLSAYTDADFELKSDAKKFCLLVSSGKLYEFISKEFKGRLGLNPKSDPFQNRESTKQFFIKALYSDPGIPYSAQSKFLKLFSKHFPSFTKVINFLKQFAKRDLAYLLQAIEARLLIDRVALPIAKENEGLPLYTIHDGIVTLMSHKELVLSRIKEVYEKELGYAPDVKCVQLSPIIAQQELKNYSNTKSHKVHQAKFKLTEQIDSPIDDKGFKLKKFMGLEPEDYTLGFPFEFIAHPDQL